MNREILWAVSALTIAGTISPASAQNPSRVQVTPTFGVYIPTNEIGPAAPGGGAWYIQLDQVDASPSFGLGIQIPLAGPVLGARVHALATLPADAAGVFNCYPGLACPAVFLASTAEVWLMAGMAELVFAPVRLHDAVRPYVLAGAGARRYHYSWPGGEVLVTGGDHGETALAVHAGLGFEIDVLGATLVTELVNYRSERGDALIAPDSQARPDSPRRRAQSDLAFNVGWRVLRF